MSILAVGDKQKIERKYLLTIAEWTGDGGYTLLTDSSAPDDWDPTECYKMDTTTGYLVRGTKGAAYAINTWYKPNSTTVNREILGVRTEDSSIELNPDTETTTDILGNTYTDVNKTEPQQDFDPFYLTGGSNLGEYLYKAMLENNINAYNGVFTIYIVSLFDGQTPSTMEQIRKKTLDSGFYTVEHVNCTILPTSFGGDSYLSMPIEVHYSNNIHTGKCNNVFDIANFDFVPDEESGS